MTDHPDGQGAADPVLMAEWAAGVQPTYEWMNFYGKLALPDGTAVPTGTVVLAVDPQGVICGATATWEAGQYGLLACYRDDPDTLWTKARCPATRIRLVVWSEGSPPQPGSWVIGDGDVDGARRPPAGAGGSTSRAAAQDLPAVVAPGRITRRCRDETLIGRLSQHPHRYGSTSSQPEDGIITENRAVVNARWQPF